ncbi:MAG TPA: GIY-YIG nuclease family protein [Pseudolabrys sp.]|nr:GIY-YIG nuclease family protein [Pseudolabrys sp.]
MPQEVYEKWGFGLAPPKKTTETSRRESAEVVLDLLEGLQLLPAVPTTLKAISEVKGLFNRVARQDQWDWFTVSRQLGYPSTRISEAIAFYLTNLRSALRDSDEPGAQETRSTLRRLPSRRCLNVFLGRSTITDLPGAGWIYILSTREIPDLLKIGMTARTVEERVREINAATGVAIPFGVRCCWRVRDPIKAEDVVHSALHHFRIRGDREFFRMEFSEAKKCIMVELAKHSDLQIRTLDSLTALTSDGGVP